MGSKAGNVNRLINCSEKEKLIKECGNHSDEMTVKF